MSNQYNIRWRLQDERELGQVAREFNRKLDRLIDKNPKMASVLPQFYNPSTEQLESWASVDSLKQVITTRKDYNRVVNMLKRFLKEGAEDIVDVPGNEYGTKATKWQVSEMKRLRNLVNAKRARRAEIFENLEMMSGEGKLGYTLGERFGMGLASRVSLNPTNAFTPAQTTQDVHFKFSSLIKQNKGDYFADKDKILKDNFIRELQRNYDREDVKDVIDSVKKMDGRLFALMFEAHGDKMEQVYPPEKGTPEYEANVEELKNYYANPELPSALETFLSNL